MKPKSSKIPTLTLLAALGSSVLAISSATAAEIQKDANADNLNLGTSWVGGDAPDTGDVALWDNTVTGLQSNALGGSVSWQGLKVTDVGGARNTTNNVRITNTAGATLTIGSAGIDMSTALQALLIQTPVTLGASQTWNVSNANNNNAFSFNNNDDLGFQAQATNTAFNLGGNELTITGSGGVVTFTSGYLISNGIMNVQTDTGIQGGNARGTSTANTLTINVSNGKTLRFGANSGSSINNAAAINVSGAGSRVTMTNFVANSTITSSGKLTLGMGTTLETSHQNTGAFTQSGEVNFTGNVNWNYIGNNETALGAVFSGNLTGSGNVSYKNTNTSATALNNQVRLSGDNSGFTGTLTLESASGTSRSLRLNTAAAGSASATWAVAADNTLQVNGVSVNLGTLNGAGSVTNSHATNVATLNVGAGSFSGDISDGAAATALTKITSGTLTLSGTNTYSGATTVSAGTLTINGSLANANVNISTGATLNGSGTLTFNIDGTSSNKVDNGGTIDLSALTVAVNPTGDGLTEPEYILVDATGGGTITGTFAALTGATGYVLDYDTEGIVKLVEGDSADPYETWAGPGVPFDGDKNGDGVSNGLAWLLGAEDPDANALDLLPVVSEDNGDLVLTFTCLKLADRGTAQLTLQYSRDLGITDPWEDDAVAVPDEAGTVGEVVFTVPSVNDDPKLVNLQARIPASEAAPDNSLFARLMAIKP